MSSNTIYPYIPEIQCSCAKEEGGPHAQECGRWAINRAIELVMRDFDKCFDPPIDVENFEGKDWLKVEDVMSLVEKFKNMRYEAS